MQSERPPLYDEIGWNEEKGSVAEEIVLSSSVFVILFDSLFVTLGFEDWAAQAD